MTQDAAKDFFISYNKADRAWAEWIGWKLEEAGYTVILQAWDFPAGSNFVIAKHINDQFRIVLLADAISCLPQLAPFSSS